MTQVSGAKRLINTEEEKEKLILALTGNDLYEYSLIFSEMFLNEYNDELALSPINILTPSMWQALKIGWKINSWLQVQTVIYGVIQEADNLNLGGGRK